VLLMLFAHVGFTRRWHGPRPAAPVREFYFGAVQLAAASWLHVFTHTHECIPHSLMLHMKSGSVPQLTCDSHRAHAKCQASNTSAWCVLQAVPNNVKFKLMAVNAIYFFGSWVLPWNKTLTSPEPFTTPDGKTMQVGQATPVLPAYCTYAVLLCAMSQQVAPGAKKTAMVLSHMCTFTAGATDACVSAGMAPCYTAAFSQRWLLRPQCCTPPAVSAPCDPTTCKHISDGQIAHAVHNMHPVLACCRST
jgi:hypothetical protein